MDDPEWVAAYRQRLRDHAAVGLDDNALGARSPGKTGGVAVSG